MPLTTPMKKTDLYSKLWASCDELRGGMDASQYKNYSANSGIWVD